jgi:hypothetical protein
MKLARRNAMAGKVNLSVENYETRLNRIEQEEIRARTTGEIVQCLKRFFSGKTYYKSYRDPKDSTKVLNEIPQDVLISPTNIDIIINTNDLNEAMTFAQENIQMLREQRLPLFKSGLMTDESETHLFISLIKEIRSLEIPFQYQGGIILLYLWLCEGIEFK